MREEDKLSHQRPQSLGLCESLCRDLLKDDGGSLLHHKEASIWLCSNGSGHPEAVQVQHHNKRWIGFQNITGDPERWGTSVAGLVAPGVNPTAKPVLSSVHLPASRFHPVPDFPVLMLGWLPVHIVCFSTILTQVVPTRNVALPAVTFVSTKAHPAKTGVAKPRVLASSATPAFFRLATDARRTP